MPAEPFGIQTTDLYNAVYKSKNYSRESSWIIRHLKEHKNDFAYCVEFGAGTGNMSLVLSAYFLRYVVIEPSKSFFEQLKFTLASKENISFYHGSLESYLSCQCMTSSVCMPRESGLYMANFNVFNYLNFKDFKDVLGVIADLASQGSLLIFDTWSLEYVAINSAFQNSFKTFDFSVKNDPRVHHLSRYSTSTYNSEPGSLDIDFRFVGCDENFREIEEYGAEIHRIYPFAISDIIAYIAESDFWTLETCQPYEIAIDELSSVVSDEYSSSRNWFFVLKRC